MPIVVSKKPKFYLQKKEVLNWLDRPCEMDEMVCAFCEGRFKIKDAVDGKYCSKFCKRIGE